MHSTVAIPNSVQEALADPRWKASMNEEIKSLQKNETWELVECPPGNDPDERKALQNYLFREFEMKDLGHLKYFLGIKVSRSMITTQKVLFHSL